MNSRQSLAAQGFGERSDFFCEYTFLQKIGVLIAWRIQQAGKNASCKNQERREKRL